MDTHPVPVAQPLSLTDQTRTEWAEIITDWSIAGYKYSRAHDRRRLPRLAATTLWRLAQLLRLLCISWANRTLKRADLYAHWDDQGEPDAILLVTPRDQGGKPPVWTIADHLSRDPGTGQGAELRADVVPLILARADAVNAALELTAANEKLADLYAKEIPGLSKRRRTLRGGITMTRPRSTPKPPKWTTFARALRRATGLMLLAATLILGVLLTEGVAEGTLTRPRAVVPVVSITLASGWAWLQARRLADLAEFSQVSVRDWTDVSHPLWVMYAAWLLLGGLSFAQQWPPLDDPTVIEPLTDTLGPLIGLGSLIGLWLNHRMIKNLENDPDLQPKVAQVDTTDLLTCPTCGGDRTQTRPLATSTLTEWVTLTCSAGHEWTRPAWVFGLAVEQQARNLILGVSRNAQAGVDEKGWWTDREPIGRFRRWPNAGASVEDVTTALDVLDVPYHVALMARTLPGGKRQAWLRIYVDAAHLDALTTQVPGLAEVIGDTAAQRATPAEPLGFTE